MTLQPGASEARAQPRVANYVHQLAPKARAIIHGTERQRVANENPPRTGPNGGPAAERRFALGGGELLVNSSRVQRSDVEDDEPAGCEEELDEVLLAAAEVKESNGGGGSARDVHEEWASVAVADQKS